MVNSIHLQTTRTIKSWRISPGSAIIYTLVIIVVLVVTLAIVAITMTRRIMKPAQTYSYIASVHTFIGGQKCPEVNEIGAGLKPDWSFFTQEQYALLQKCLERHITDLDRKNTKNGRSKVLSDDWGERVIIAGRRKGFVICDFILWSKGPDHILGTSDDISSPWRVPIPSNLQQDLPTINEQRKPAVPGK